MITDNKFFTYTALGLAVLFWGLSFVVTKIALESFPPLCLIFCRFCIAAIFFAALLWRRGFPQLTLKSSGSLLLLAILQPGLYFCFETYGLQYTSATKTSLIIATIPIFVLIVSALFLNERLRPINLLGVVLSLMGVTLLIFGAEDTAGLHGMLFGDLLIFGAVLSATGYMVLTRKLGERFSSLEITGMQIIFGAFLFLPAFLTVLPSMEWEKVTRESLWALLALTFFATILAFLCYNYALTRIPAARAAVCINGIPLVTACGAWMLLGETLSPMQLCGGATVLVAVVLANKTVRSAAHRENTALQEA